MKEKNQTTVNTALLKSQMLLAKVTSNDLAEKLGLSRSTISFKLNGKSDFTIGEVAQIQRILGFDDLTRDKIFFAKEV